MDVLFLIGRLLFGGYFVYNGANHFLQTPMLVEMTAAKGVPAPELAVMAAGLLILFGGLSVLLGAWPQVGSLLIALFLLGVTPIMHDFWAVPDAQRIGEMINFTKNMALLGSTLMLLLIPRPWPYSVERRRVSLPA